MKPMINALVVRVLLFIAALTTAINFVKSSTDVEKHRPQNVVVQVINETTVRLEWNRPKSAELAGCPISRYTVRLRSDGVRRSRTWKVDGDRRSVTLYGLDPTASYHVRVLAVVCHGKSKPSPWVGVRTARSVHSVDDDAVRPDEPINDQLETAVPGKPTYVRTRTFTDSVMVSWMPPEDGDVVRGYVVGYGEGVPDVNWRYLDASSNNVTIRNLKPATQYIISLRAFNNVGKGQVIYDLIYTRDSSGPTIPRPDELLSKVLSPSTVWLEWKDPSLGRVQQLTDSRYYNVHYRPLMTQSAVNRNSTDTRGAGGVAGRTLSVVVKATHVVFYDLRPGTRYEFKVRTVKDAVASAFSDTVVNKTYETAPGSPPRTVTVLNTNVSGMVNVSWRVPRLPNGDITGYMVLYTTNVDLPPEEWQVKSVAGPEMQTSLSNLTLNTTYHLRLQARNSIGYSPMSSSTVFYSKSILTPASTPSPTEVTPSNLAEVTTRSANSSSTNAVNDDDDDDAGRLVTQQLDANITTQRSKQPTAASKTKRDDGPAKAVDVPPPSPPLPEPHRAASPHHVAFTATVQHHVTAFVTWPQPEVGRCDGVTSRGAAVTGYRLRYGNSATSTELHLNSNVVAIDGLLPASEYWYQLQYLFDDGSHSPWTEKQVLET